MTEPETDIFGKKAPLHIRNVRISGKPAEVYIENGIIKEIDEKITGHDAELVIDGNRATALPGLYNMHCHASMTLLRGYSDDMQLFEWLSTLIWPTEKHLTPDDIYWGAKLACLEMIRTGTVFFNDMYFSMDRVADAVNEGGIRAYVPYCTIDNGDPEKRAAEIRIAEETVRYVKAMNNSRVMAALGPHAVYTESEEALLHAAEFAKKENIPIHIHIAETEKEVQNCIAAHGMRPPKWLEKCGIFSVPCIAPHSCWLNEEDIAIYAKHGVTAVMNPISNMKLAGGKAVPYRELVNAGVNVALGTDGASSNNSLDMFEEMKIASLLQKFSTDDPTVMPASEVLKIASYNGAKAAGLKAGLLAPGYLADIILIDRNPSSVPTFSTESNAVYATCGKDVNTTICDGVVLMHDKFIPGIEDIMTHAEDAAYSLAERAGVRKTA